MKLPISIQALQQDLLQSASKEKKTNWFAVSHNLAYLPDSPSYTGLVPGVNDSSGGYAVTKSFQQGKKAFDHLKGVLAFKTHSSYQ